MVVVEKFLNCSWRVYFVAGDIKTIWYSVFLGNFVIKHYLVSVMNLDLRFVIVKLFITKNCFISVFWSKERKSPKELIIRI